MTELRRPEVAPALGDGKQRAGVTLRGEEVAGLELHLFEGVERNRLELGRPVVLGDGQGSLTVIQAPVEAQAVRPGEREPRVTAHEPGRIAEHLGQVERLVEQRGGGAVVDGPGEDGAELLERRELQAADRGARAPSPARAPRPRVRRRRSRCADASVARRRTSAPTSAPASSSVVSRTAASTWPSASIDPETASASSAAAT